MTARLAAPAFVLLLAAAAAQAEAPMQVDVARRGAVYMVSAAMEVPVTVAEAWGVMTDYDGMARFVPNLSESRVVERAGQRWTVEQKGVARFGPLRLRFESTRELDLTPTERVASRQVKGEMRSVSSVTTFAHAGGGTRITYSAQMEPGFWFPAFVSERLIANALRDQFEAFAGEMVRRHAQGKDSQ